jgi:hypothetical protein
MDVVGWIVLSTTVAAAVAFAVGGPWMLRSVHRHGTTAGLGGIGSGLDAVWRPSAEEARAQWEAEVRLPAPAPLAGDKGRIEDGRIVIRVNR